MAQPDAAEAGDVSDRVITQEFVNGATTRMIFYGASVDFETVLAGIRDGRVSVTVTEEGLTLRAVGRAGGGQCSG